MPNFLKIIAVIFLLFSSACSYKNNIKASLSGDEKTLQITDKTTIPNADYFTASEVLGASIGGVAGSFVFGSTGLISLSHNDDPANYFKNNIGEILAQKYDLKIIQSSKEPVIGKHSVNAIIENYPEGDLILDANSSISGKYYPFRLNNFRTNYRVYIRLIDRRTNSVIFKSNCSYNDKKDNDYTLQQIANQSEVVAGIFEKAKTRCLEKFQQQITK
jgi:hypothetical protein